MALDTDLALELFTDSKKRVADICGASAYEYRYEHAEATLTEIDINDTAAAEIIGRPVGKYITIEFDAPIYEYSPFYEERCGIVTESLKKICPETGAVLFAGLGNRFMTPDSIGPLASDRVFATAHIYRYADDIYTDELSESFVLSAGVMSQTGIESSDLIKSVCSSNEIKRVIVCDALACHEPSHMGKTIQLCSTGISPGSGVGNSRSEISQSSLGIPVAAIGVPSVTRLMSDDPRFKELIVTPKQIDKLAERSAAMISDAVNMFLHPGFTREEIASFM